MDSFIVRTWLSFLQRLSLVSPFQWVCWIFPGFITSYGFVDVWVLGHAALCIVLLGLLSLFPELLTSPWRLLVCAYGALRVLEIVTTNATNLFFVAPQGSDPKRAYALRSYRRIVILALHNYAEVVLWFAIFYGAFLVHFTTPTCGANKSLCVAYFSLVTMATVGYGDIYPKDDVGRFIVCVQVSVAIFLTLIILARVIAYLPRPPSLDPDEDCQ